MDRKQQFKFKPKNVHPKYEKTLNTISSICKENKIDCIFITQPSGYQIGADQDFKAGFWMTPPNEEYTLDFESMVYISTVYNRFLCDFAHREGHRVCNLANELSPSYEFFYDDCHFNIKGSEQFANSLYSYLSLVLEAR